MTKRLLDTARGLFGDVLVERARHRARGEDALDGAMLEGAEGRGVPERRVDILGAKALAQEQDLTRLTAPDAGRAEAHQAEESGRALAHSLEGDLDLIEIDRALAMGRRMELAGVELQAEAARRELVACDAREVCGVDEELALGHAHGQDVGDVVVGNGVAVTFPLDEPVDAADAIDDAGGVVGMPRQRDEVLALLDKALEGGGLVAPARVDDLVDPARELSAHVVEIAKRATVEERTLDLPE